ncbi:MAG: hypothetical protein AB8H79_07825 [Myxococcota bacterium]
MVDVDLATPSDEVWTFADQAQVRFPVPAHSPVVSGDTRGGTTTSPWIPGGAVQPPGFGV